MIPFFKHFRGGDLSGPTCPSIPKHPHLSGARVKLPVSSWANNGDVIAFPKGFRGSGASSGGGGPYKNSLWNFKMQEFFLRERTEMSHFGFLVVYFSGFWKAHEVKDLKFY